MGNDSTVVTNTNAFICNVTDDDETKALDRFQDQVGDILTFAFVMSLMAVAKPRLLAGFKIKSVTELTKRLVTDEKVGMYPHRGVPLTPAVAQVLIRNLFSGQLIARQVIVDEVLRLHLARGGIRGGAQITHTIKKALALMKGNGLAENAAVGYWRIHTHSLEADQNLSIEQEEVEGEVFRSDQPIAPEPAADVELGLGSGAVYLYYLPTYRLHAQDRGETAWPCKIGRTDRDPLERILAQASTALPERPRIALVIRTFNPSAWESAFHSVLTLRGLKIENSPGMEWFLTSPEEVLSLAAVFDPSLSQAISIVLAQLSVQTDGS